ncbi:MAG: WhiB family transcriptional regulator, redox-sensing transcriptional regulator [Frankiales bacterium]|nr:WhiB family transcriptional regulator, redox-sensing transcriptional regulator [Frankiales bacterium]
MFPLETAFQSVDVEGWRAEAQCMGELSSYFFSPSHFERKPEKDAREGVARRLCAACPVVQTCAEYAIRIREPHGIWGGMNELERRRVIRRRQGDQAQSA